MNQPPGYGSYGAPSQGYPQQPPPPPKKGMSTFAAVLLALIVFFVVIPLGSCVACAVCAGVKKGMDDANAHAGDGSTPVSTATASTAPMAAPTTTSTTVAVSFATFTPKGTLLDECIDFIITPPSGTDGGSEFTDAFAKAVAKGKKSTSRIYKACNEQFRTTPALATCGTHISLPLKNDGGAAWGTVEIDSEERYYNLDSLTNSNEYMKDCLDMKGDWQGVDKDSPEYREAVRSRSRARREVEKLQKSLGQ
jgi:hypothetical protein